MLRRLPWLAVVLLGFATAFVLSAPAAPQDAAMVFTDPGGDSKGAADITKVVVSRAETAATFTIEVWAPKPTAALQAPTASPPPVSVTTYFISVHLDIDNNASTGPSGFEYSFTTHGSTWDSRAWNGTTWAPTPFTPVTASNGLGVYTWTIARFDVGNPTSFSFRVTSSAIVSRSNGGATTTLGPDLAPDSGTWASELVPPPPPPSPPTTTQASAPRPVIGAPSTTPARATAGARLSVTFRITRSDTGAPLTKGTMICDPSIGGKVLKHVESFSNGAARLSFTLPRASKGTLLRVKLTIRSGTQSATRVASLRVR